MDIVEPSTDFQGWELLKANSDAESEKSFPEIDSEGFIHTNYFSSEPQNSYGDDEKLASSGNPSWIEPGLEEVPAHYLHKESCDFWSDSGSELSENREITALGEGNEVGFPEREKSVGDAGVSGEKGSLHMDSAVIGQEVLDTEVKQSLRPDPEILNEEESGCKVVTGIENGLEKSVNKMTKDVEKETMVWWKMPLEFLKYCVFRMSPVWSVSFAAAVMGFVILGRRLYRMRNRARALEVKLAVDDKKASRAMSQAARLNEAFSIVKRVPAIRPAFPAVGSTAPWAVMLLR